MAKLTLTWPRGKYHREINVVWTTPGPTTGYSTSLLTVRHSASPPEVEELFVRETWIEDYEVRAEAIYKKLVTSTPDAFVDKFGLLTTRGETELVADFEAWRDEVERLLAWKKADDWGMAKKWLEANSRAIQLTGSFGEDDCGRPQLEFRPTTLLGYTLAQLVQDWSTGVQYRWCKRPGCQEWFYYGPGTKHRETAEYCGPTCRNAQYYLEKTRRKK